VGTLFGNLLVQLSSIKKAPEMADGQAGKPNDIFAFAMLCYYLISGKHPFEKEFKEAEALKENPLRVVKTLMTSNNKRPDLNEAFTAWDGVAKSKVSDKVKSQLRNLIETCWQREPSQRLTASQVIAVLQIIHLE